MTKTAAPTVETSAEFSRRNAAITASVKIAARFELIDCPTCLTVDDPATCPVCAGERYIPTAR